MGGTGRNCPAPSRYKRSYRISTATCCPRPILTAAPPSTPITLLIWRLPSTIAQGIREHWSVTVNPNNYDDFGGYSSISVNVNVYGKTASVNGVITTGTPSKNQRYIIVKADSTTPSSEALLASYFYEEISNTSKGVCGASIILVQ